MSAKFAISYYNALLFLLFRSENLLFIYFSIFPAIVCIYMLAAPFVVTCKKIHEGCTMQLKFSICQIFPSH